MASSAYISGFGTSSTRKSFGLYIRTAFILVLLAFMR